MPHWSLPEATFLCVVLAGFFAFMITLIYVSIAVTVAEKTSDVATEVTPARRAASLRGALIHRR